MAPVQNAVLVAVPVANPPLLVRRLLEDAEKVVRQESLRDFYNANHSKAVVFAKSFLNDDDEASDAVAHTCLKLLAGKTTQNHFFRALKQTCLDRLRRLKRESGLFSSPDTAVSIEPISEELDDQDPLDILIRREESAICQAMVGRAMTDPRWRYIKGRQWAQSLVGDVRK